MNFRDLLSAEMPAPRDDEPGSLREDILDELADHLHCAYRRELLRGADAPSARARALERFGEPARVARRLWLDAMRGKIMTQRILVACCVLLVLVSLGLVGVFWMQTVQLRRMAMEQRAMAAERLHEAQQAQEKMLKQLQELSRSVARSQTPDWIPVKFKLTQETADGPPAVGVKANLGKGNGGAKKPDSIERESDPQGIVDFGVVQPGDWEFLLTRPMADQTQWRTLGKLNALPGTTIEKTVVCPPLPEERMPISVRIDWPSDLKSKELYVAVGVSREPVEYQPPLRWRWSSPYGSVIRQVLVVSSGGAPAERSRMMSIHPPTFWNNMQRNGLNEGQSRPMLLAALDSPSPNEGATQVHLEAGEYRCDRLIVLEPASPHEDQNPIEDFRLLALAAKTQQNWTYRTYDVPMDVTRIPSVRPSFGNTLFPDDPVSPDYWNTRAGPLIVEKGKPNEWVITMPEELLAKVRERLKDEKK
jgi:hypothetical protein